MVQLRSLLLLGLLPACAVAQHKGDIFAPLEKLADLTEGAVKAGLGLFFNESQIEAMASQNEVVPHRFAADLTDDNWQAVLKTGTDNPLAPPLDSNTTWVIHVYGKDQASQLLARPFDEVANDNSSLAGGVLPSNMLFARLSYEKETILATRLWIWKAPVVVITDPSLSEIRYYKIGQIIPRQDALAELLNNRELYMSRQPWQGRLAPGGAWEPALVKLADFFAWWHKYMSKIPNIVWVMLSGAIMNVVLNFMHTKNKKDEAKKAANEPGAILSREQQRAALKERLAKEKREKEAAEREAAEQLEKERLAAEKLALELKAQAEAEDAPIEEVDGSTATKKKSKATKRK